MRFQVTIFADSIGLFLTAGCGDNSLRVVDLMHREHRVDPRGSWLIGVGWKREVTVVAENSPSLLTCCLWKIHLLDESSCAFRSTLLGSHDPRGLTPVLRQ